MKEGERIYVESLIESDEEYKELARKYPNTYQSNVRPQFFESTFKWRYRMGKGMTPEMIKKFNQNLVELKAFLIELARLKKEKENG